MIRLPTAMISPVRINRRGRCGPRKAAPRYRAKPQEMARAMARRDVTSGNSDHHLDA